jgi:hypothetical protein
MVAVRDGVELRVLFVRGGKRSRIGRGADGFGDGR